ncbi:hypothetical protein [Azospirillum argentinense]|uniref:GIY-YIG domain-containing protein n=1 Tax=Azospirillum brasilense TaxID=192 RepID=A0A4D8QAW7_AZOBR|nr:hypothetical protein [Azospirillum argentinense]QCO07448.1 hypothetical protein D3867_36810 [Azospirillum argentinense]
MVIEADLEGLRIWTDEPQRISSAAHPQRVFQPWLRAMHRMECARAGACHYVYVLCASNGVPIYVGYSGTDDRPLDHRNPATSCNQTLLREIRRIERQGGEVLYEIDFVSTVLEEALRREEFLVRFYGRRDGEPPGLLCNLREGGGGPPLFSAETLARRGATLKGPFYPVWEHWFRDVPGIRMDSIPIDHDKWPGRCFARASTDIRPKPIQFTRKPRLFAALALSAWANGIALIPRCRVPRRLFLDDREVFLGKGVCNDVLEQSGVRLCDARRAEDQAFELSSAFIARMIHILGAPLLRRMGICPRIWRLHRHWSSSDSPVTA